MKETSYTMQNKNGIDYTQVTPYTVNINFSNFNF